jgi:beta-glucosidase
MITFRVARNARIPSPLCSNSHKTNLKNPSDQSLNAGPFLWGAATSAHQVEGNNRNSDWWAWEQAGEVPYPSGKACDHWNQYLADFNLAQSLSHNAHRFSIEWSRIEPREGLWDETSLQHYSEVLEALRSRKLTPIVTLHHFTNPRWFSEKGGWAWPGASAAYLGYVDKVVQRLGLKAEYWIPINEPLVYVYYTYLSQIWPSKKKGMGAMLEALRQLERAYLLAYTLIHRFASSRNHTVRVGIAKAFMPFYPCQKTKFLSKPSCTLRDYLFNKRMIARFARRKALDFIGVNYYTRDFIQWGGVGPMKLIGMPCPASHGHTQNARTTMDWEIYPEGLGVILNSLRRYRLPILITENGAAVQDDATRTSFIEKHIEVVQQAAQKGLSIMGYLYWSLFDNFEWDRGFHQHFGLIEVDPKDLSRRVRPSAKRYREIIQNAQSKTPKW